MKINVRLLKKVVRLYNKGYYTLTEINEMLDIPNGKTGKALRSKVGQYLLNR